MQWGLASGAERSLASRSYPGEQERVRAVLRSPRAAPAGESCQPASLPSFSCLRAGGALPRRAKPSSSRKGINPKPVALGGGRLELDRCFLRASEIKSIQTLPGLLLLPLTLRKLLREPVGMCLPFLEAGSAVSRRAAPAWGRPAGAVVWSCCRGQRAEITMFPYGERAGCIKNVNRNLIEAFPKGSLKGCWSSSLA